MNMYDTKTCYMYIHFKYKPVSNQCYIYFIIDKKNLSSCNRHFTLLFQLSKINFGYSSTTLLSKFPKELG